MEVRRRLGMVGQPRTIAFTLRFWRQPLLERAGFTDCLSVALLTVERCSGPASRR
jgi:hypothetical protein